MDGFSVLFHCAVVFTVFFGRSFYSSGEFRLLVFLVVAFLRRFLKKHVVWREHFSSVGNVRIVNGEIW